MEHAAHGGHDHAAQHGPALGLGMLVGITMAMLGAMLAFAGAKVGGERTELVKTMVEQEHAHAKYQAQDIKHRTAVIALRQVHAAIAPTALATFESDLKKLEADSGTNDKGGRQPNDKDTAAAVAAVRVLGQNIIREIAPKPDDVLLLANTVDRYYGESQAADEWVKSYDPAIEAHSKSQERYELAQLAAEFGIVIASIALLLKHRLPWFLAIALGLICVGILAFTYSKTESVVREAEVKIEETGKKYRELRDRDKTTATDDALVEEVRQLYGPK
jgi:hypothetical protein